MREAVAGPFEITRLLYSAGRSLRIARLTLLNVPGALEAVAKEVAGFGINTIQTMVINPSVERTRHVDLILFLDFTEAAVELRELEERLKAIGTVKALAFVEAQLPGLIADTLHFPLTVMGERAVLFRKSLLKGLLKGIRERFGSAGEAFLYYEGKDLGRAAFESYREFFQGLGRKDLLEANRLVACCLGWARYDIAEMDEAKVEARLKVYENWECEIGRELKAEGPYAQLVRGALAGFFSGYFGVDMRAVEERCIAKGDPYCEFLLSRTRETEGR